MDRPKDRDISSEYTRGEDITPEIAFYLPEHARNPKVLKCAIVGCGMRGQTYAQYAEDFPHLVKIVAVADPRLHQRKLFERKHGVPESMQFKNWKELVKLGKVADFVCICTPDKLHKDPAIAFAKKGYHILLEKPMATTEGDCIAIKDICEENKVMLAVCHVLRYYPPNKKIKELIESGVIGNVVNIQHIEPAGHWHYAHSYVRGNWCKTEESTFALMGKCCHDVDLIVFWMKNQKSSQKDKKCTCKAVSSFGSLHHFKKENMPHGAADRCLDCAVEKSCPYSALKTYMEPAKSGQWGFPVSIVTDVEDIEALTDRLRNGPYGKCVYNSDNDVCDHQVVNFQFSGGQTASLTMIAFTESICLRRTKVFGTKGELTYDGSRGSEVTHYDFLTDSHEIHHCKTGLGGLSSVSGHSGADFHMIDAFVKAVMYDDPTYIQTGPDETVESHLLCFAAEESRLSGKTVNIK